MPLPLLLFLGARDSRERGGRQHGRLGDDDGAGDGAERVRSGRRRGILPADIEQTSQFN